MKGTGNQRIKWLILLIPTLTIGLWEYVRHAFLLPYMTMELGNLLAPVIVLAVTLTVVRGLFRRLEQSQAELEREQAANAALGERESLARELHDGIAQSLFLLAVKLDQLDRVATEEPARRVAAQLRETVRDVNEDVRQAIANLQLPPSAAEAAWVVPVRELLAETAGIAQAEAEFRWSVPDDALTDKEKVELHACLREALINVRKHARAKRVLVIGEREDAPGEAGERDGGYRFAVADDGVGFDGDPLGKQARFGLRMVRDRAAKLGWAFEASRRDGWTVVELRKGGGSGHGQRPAIPHPAR